MEYSLKILNDAFVDIETAFDYYFQISPKLAVKFNKELNKGYNTLQKTTFFQLRYSDYRMFPLKKFPYSIVYVVDENVQLISIYSVFHNSQHPDKLLNYSSSIDTI